MQVSTVEMGMATHHRPPSATGIQHPHNSDGYDTFSQQPLMFSNQYSMRKTASQGAMDVALIVVNISQLRTLLDADDDIKYRVILIIMVVLSLSLQVILVILISTIWVRENEQHKTDKYERTLRQVTETASGTDSAAETAIRNSRQMSYQRHRITTHLSYVTMALITLIMFINICITSFGISLDSPKGCLLKTNSS